MMLCPSYEVKDFGVFDSKIKFPKRGMSEKRRVQSYELELITESDNAVFYFDDQSYQMTPNIIFVGKPGMVRHTKLHFKCIYVHLKTENTDLQKYLNRIPNVISLAGTTAVRKLFMDVLRVEGESIGFQKNLHLQVAVSDLLSYLGNFIGPTEGKRDTAYYLHQNTLIKIDDYIHSHLNENLELQKLAEIANLSAIYFHKIFTEYFGETPSHYVTECRIRAAKVMLISDNRSISEIADRCGFSSQSYFNCKFKELVGISPLKYRKNMLTKIKL